MTSRFSLWGLGALLASALISTNAAAQANAHIADYASRN